MSKGKIITISIISSLAIILVILFSFVFCLYGEKVSFLNEVEVESEDIIQAGELKHGTPIFRIDKQSAIDRIEKKYPSIRVDAIRTISVRSVEYVISKREPVYSIQIADKYLALDEDLKVLSTNADEVGDLIELNLDIEQLECEAGDFVLPGYAKILNVLYDSIEMYVTLPNESNEYNYLSRAEICAFIDTVSINSGAGNKLTITLDNQFKITIDNSAERLAEKVNIGFSTYNALYNREKAAGKLDAMPNDYSIIVSYDKDNNIFAGLHHNN